MSVYDQNSSSELKRELEFVPDRVSVCLLCSLQPVYLYSRLNTGAGKPNANKHKCCVVQ